MKLCRFDYKRSDGSCALNGKPCKESCNSIVEIDESPRTHKSVLLERWAKDTREMATERIYHSDYAFYGDFEGSVIIFSDKIGSTENYDKAREEAIRLEIAYLNSAAE